MLIKLYQLCVSQNYLTFIKISHFLNPFKIQLKSQSRSPEPEPEPEYYHHEVPIKQQHREPEPEPEPEAPAVPIPIQRNKVDLWPKRVRSDITCLYR